MKGLLVAQLADSEAANQGATYAIGALRVLVLPGSRIPRARGQHVHVMPAADLFGENTARVIGPGADVGAVPRCHEGKFHASAPSFRTHSDLESWAAKPVVPSLAVARAPQGSDELRDEDRSTTPVAAVQLTRKEPAAASAARW